MQSRRAAALSTCALLTRTACMAGTGTAGGAHPTCQCQHASTWATTPTRQRSWQGAMAAGMAATLTTSAPAAAAAWVAAGTVARKTCST